jgi:hypothetical protein
MVGGGPSYIVALDGAGRGRASTAKLSHEDQLIERTAFRFAKLRRLDNANGRC